MKTKSILASAMLATFVLGAVTPTALAAETYTDAKSSVGFEAPTGEGATDPTEVTPPAVLPPIGPVKPGPGEPGQGGTNGPLGLSVPKDLRFGSDNKINLKGDTYKALTTTFTNTDFPKVVLPPMIVVKDVRGLKNGDWDLKVSASEFHEYEAGVKGAELKGLTIAFKDAKVFNSQDPNFSGANITMGGNGNLTLSNQLASLMSAKDGHGNGETTYIGDSKYKIEDTDKIYKEGDRVDGILLNVPASAAAQINVGSTYQSELTWTISSTAD